MSMKAILQLADGTNYHEFNLDHDELTPTVVLDSSVGKAFVLDEVTNGYVYKERLFKKVESDE